MTARCVDDGLHQWPDDFDPDNWQRCMRGCGCGRPRLGRWPGRLHGPEEVPSLAGAPPTEALQAPSERNLCVAPNRRHSWPARPDWDGWMRCVRLGCGAGRRWNEHTARPATQASAPAEEGTAPHQRLAPCGRCGARMLLERDVDGDLEQVCINGHRRYGRSPEELAEMLAHEEHRRRQPSHGGARL